MEELTKEQEDFVLESHREEQINSPKEKYTDSTNYQDAESSVKFHSPADIDSQIKQFGMTNPILKQIQERWK